MFTLYSADFIGNPGNCSYPHKTVVMDADSMRAAVGHDYVCAEYKNHYRNSDNFLSADCLPVDCDNDHSEDPKDWITPADVLEAFPGVSLAIHYSRFNQREKNGKPARPKFHVLFPIDRVTDASLYSDMKKLVNSIFPYFDKNIPVYFEKEAINTLDAKGEVLITIMASLAQQESQSMSQNIKLGLQYRYQQGKVQVNHNRFLGYTKDDNGHLIIDPEQAEIVKRIYREYLEGSSMDKIADGLMADGILTGAGKTKWHTSTINKILRNEKYMGDALLQKTYTTDFLTKKRIKNNGTVPQYYVEGDHEAIIPKELFMQVQAELVRRRVVHVSPTGKKRSFSCNHCFAQMVFCGDCGELYRRVHWNNHGCKSIVWRCISRLEPTSAEKNCTNRTVNELLLQEVTVKAFHQILTERDFFLKTLQQNIAKAVVNADTLSPDGIQTRLEELQKELIKKANNKQDYDAIADEIFRLRDQKEQSELDSHHREEAMNRIKELQDFIAGQETDITEFDEALVKKLIEKITVFADHFSVDFKSGITIDIEA